MSDKERRGISPEIIAALIGVAGTVAVAFFFSQPQSTSEPATPVSIVVTATPIPTTVPADTAQPVELTSIAVPTDMPTPISVLDAGKDWLQGCISTAWIVYPPSVVSPSADGCYVKPLADVFSVRNQHLDLFVDKSVPSSETVGVYVELPIDSVVTLFMHLDKITTGELWVGVTSGDDILNNTGYLIVVPEGNPLNSAFEAYTMPDENRFYLSQKFKKDSGEYEISFDVSPNEVSATIEKYSPISPKPVNSEKKYLFIGYQAIFGKRNHIEADFFDLMITAR